MLRVMHRYQRSILGFVALGLIVVAMSGFGVDILNLRGKKDTKDYAIKVNESLISYRDYQDRRRQLEERYRRQYGAQIVDMMRSNIGTQVKDDLIEEALLEQEAEKQGLFVSEAEVRNEIEEQFGGRGNFNKELYAAYIKQYGVGIEQKIRRGLLLQQYANILKDVSWPSDAEVRGQVIQNETVYGASALEVDPAASALVSGIPAPTDKEIEEYYAQHATDFELPARVQYDYAVFRPADFAAAVQVPPSDVEMHYSDNLNQYMTRPEAHVRHIQVNFPAKANAEQMAATKTKAEEILAKVGSGESFESLALQSSDDVTTKVGGGDMGWISQGSKDKEFEDVVFSMNQGDPARLVSTNYGFHIVRVEGIHEPQAKPLESVRAEIEKEIRDQEAPSYAAGAAADSQREWLRGDITLAQAIEKGSKWAKPAVEAGTKLLASGEDPSPLLAGLSEKVLGSAETERKLSIDLTGATVLVDVKERKSEETPPLADVKGKVIEALKKIAAKDRAEKQARTVLADLQAKKYADLSTAARANQFAFIEEKELKHTKPGRGVFREPAVQKFVFNTTTPGTLSAEPFESQGKYYLVQINTRNEPIASEIEKNVAKVRDQATQESMAVLIKSVINRLKSAADIDIQARLLEE